MSIVFDRAVAYYDQTRGLPPQIEQWIGTAVRDQGGLRAGSQVLEIGVGTGRIALPLVTINRFRYIGIDLSQPMMDVLRRKNGALPIELVRTDATRLPFADATFDAVVAVHVFHLFGAAQQAMDEVARVRRPGGVFLTGYNHTTEASDIRDLRLKLSEYAGTEAQRHVGGLIERDRIRPELEQRFGVPRELASPAWTTTTTPDAVIRQFGDRIWSNTWNVAEDDMTRALAEGRRWAIETFGSLDAPINETQHFVWEVYGGLED